MLRKILSIISATVVLAGCSSAYKGTQTPDDVYYSPARPLKDAYAVNERRDNRYNNYDNRYNNGDYEDYTSSSEDMYLRMKIQNRYRWGMLDDFNYWNMPGYSLNFGYGYGGFNPYTYNPYVMNNWYGSSFYSPFWGLNSLSWFGTYYPMYSYNFYNPYYGYGWHGGIYNPIIISKYPNNNSALRPGVSRPALNSYRNGLYNNNNSRRYNNNNYNNNNGRRTYTPAQTGRYNNNSNSNNNNTPSQPTRSYTPSSSGSSSSGGSTPRSGGVSRPPR